MGQSLTSAASIDKTKQLVVEREDCFSCAMGVVPGGLSSDGYVVEVRLRQGASSRETVVSRPRAVYYVYDFDHRVFVRHHYRSNRSIGDKFGSYSGRETGFLSCSLCETDFRQVISIPNCVSEVGAGCCFRCESLQRVMFGRASTLEQVGVQAFMWANIKTIQLPVFLCCMICVFLNAVVFNM